MTNEATIARRPLDVRRPERTRLGPALLLFVLAPLVGEFLLGNLPITWLGALVVLAPLYGGGALVIREAARRLGTGWPGIVALGLAYAIVEEAFVTGSLFNRHYLGLNLLDYGYLPFAGMGAWWTLFVLTLHTVWSTAVPTALVESLTRGERTRPWLGWKGLVVSALVFLVGCVATFAVQQPPYIASAGQYLGSGVALVLLMLLAIRLRRAVRTRSGAAVAAPRPAWTGVAAFCLGSAFMGLAGLVGRVPAAVNVAGMIVVLSLGGGLLWRWSGRAGWSGRHELAASGGLLMTYAWYGFVQVPSVAADPVVDAVGNAVFATAAAGLLWWAWRRQSEEGDAPGRASPSTPG